MNNINNHIDDVFSEGLNNLEQPFDPKAWEKMLATLEENDHKIAAPIAFSKKYHLKKITIMTTTGIILAALLYTAMPSKQNTQVKDIKVSNPSNHSFNNNSASSNNNIYKDESNTQKSTNNYIKQAKQWKAANNSPLTAKTFNITNNSISNPIYNSYQENLIENLKPKSIYSFDQSILKLNDSLPDFIEQIFGKPKKKYRYNGPWIGLHLAYAAPIGSLRKDGYRHGWGGNLELMSGDIVKSKQLGIFLGGSLGILQHGSGNDYNVLLQTPNNDSGYTYLYNMNFNFDFIARFELGNYRLKPYADLVVGFRGMNTYQRIDSKKTIEGFESSDISSLSSWGTHWGGSLGLRYHLVPGLSLDGRVTYYAGDKYNWANVKLSNYSPGTGSFNLNQHSSNLEMLHFRLGFLFEINELSENSNNSVYHGKGYQNRRGGNINIGGGNGGGNRPSKGMKIQVPRN